MGENWSTRNSHGPGRRLSLTLMNLKHTTIITTTRWTRLSYQRPCSKKDMLDLTMTQSMPSSHDTVCGGLSFNDYANLSVRLKALDVDFNKHTVVDEKIKLKYEDFIKSAIRV